MCRAYTFNYVFIEEILGNLKQVKKKVKIIYNLIPQKSPLLTLCYTPFQSSLYTDLLIWNHTI